jgi:hypothetical protein
MRCLLLSSLLAVSCIVPAPTSGSGGQQPQAGAQRPAQGTPATPAPPAEVRNGANFEDKVELVGATVAPSRAAPGEAVRITAFWKVLDEIPADYTIFVHVEDVDGRTDRLNADHQPANGTRPTSSWKKGETIKDDFTIYVPPQMQVRGLNVLIGLWEPKTDSRMKLKNPEAVRNDNNNRVLLAQLPVSAT